MTEMLMILTGIHTVTRVFLIYVFMGFAVRLGWGLGSVLIDKIKNRRKKK